MDRIARERAPLVVRAVGVAGRKRMLDVGGGSAAYSIAFCRANPDLEAEVFDLPSVVGIAHRYIEGTGLAARIRTRGGDLERDGLGSGFDLVLVSQICHSLSEAGNLALLKKCRAALMPGGTLVIQEFILEADKTGPKFAALFALNMLVGTPSGNTYNEEEMSAWMRTAGFMKIRRIRLPGPSGLILATRE
jgi:SAM-dependent methyltransferase